MEVIPYHGFEDRTVEHPNRVKLRPVEGLDGVFDVERLEGDITREGTPLTAETMNQLVLESDARVGSRITFSNGTIIREISPQGNLAINKPVSLPRIWSSDWWFKILKDGVEGNTTFIFDHSQKGFFVGSARFYDDTFYKPDVAPALILSARNKAAIVEMNNKTSAMVLGNDIQIEIDGSEYHARGFLFIFGSHAMYSTSGGGISFISGSGMRIVNVDGYPLRIISFNMRGGHYSLELTFLVLFLAFIGGRHAKI